MITPIIYHDKHLYWPIYHYDKRYAPPVKSTNWGIQVLVDGRIDFQTGSSVTPTKLKTIYEELSLTSVFEAVYKCNLPQRHGKHHWLSVNNDLMATFYQAEVSTETEPAKELSTSSGTKHVISRKVEQVKFVKTIDHLHHESGRIYPCAYTDHTTQAALELMLSVSETTEEFFQRAVQTTSLNPNHYVGIPVLALNQLFEAVQPFIQGVWTSEGIDQDEAISFDRMMHLHESALRRQFLLGNTLVEYLNKHAFPIKM